MKWRYYHVFEYIRKKSDKKKFPAGVYQNRCCSILKAENEFQGKNSLKHGVLIRTANKRSVLEL